MSPLRTEVKLRVRTGMCRAHGIAYQRVAEPGGLRGALAAAWGLNRHSVVEVTTARRANVAHHRYVQAAVRAAVSRALHLATRSGTGARYLFLPRCY